MILELLCFPGLISAGNPFWDRLRAVVERLDPVSAFLFLAVGLGVVVFMFFSERRVEWILLSVIASSALVGSSNDMIDNGASVVRWIGIGVLVLVPLMSERVTGAFRGSPALFGFYAFFCFLFLSRALEANYQTQRALLLLATCIAIPWATALVCKDGVSVNRLYTNIGLFGSVVALVAAAQLPGQLGVAARFAGTAKGVPYFAIAMGSLLPFMFLNAWNAGSRLMSLFYWITFVLGGVVLFFTAQRAGTLAGVVSLLPILLVLRPSQKFRVAAIVGAVAVGVVVWAGTAGPSTLDYITGRYGANTGLSGRDMIWSTAWRLTSQNIFVGHGTGGADLAMEYLFHNSYLEAWYNGGLFALLCFVGALCRSIYIGLVLIWSDTKELKGPLALSLGLILGICFVSFFEGATAAASTITVILYLVTTTIMERAYQHLKLLRQTPQSPAQVEIVR